MGTPTQRTDLQQAVENIIGDIPQYWGRPTRTHPAITTVNQIHTGQQPPPRGWHQPKEPQ